MNPAATTRCAIAPSINPVRKGAGECDSPPRLTPIAFAELGLHRIFGRCDACNGASANLMARLGMRCEAHFRHNEIFKGTWGDEYVYALLHSEWVANQPSKLGERHTK